MTKINISAAFFSSNDPDDPQGWRLHVEDALSGTVLVDAQCTPSEFMSLIRGGQIGVEGFIAADLHRVGKKMRYFYQEIPYEVAFDNYTHDDTSAEKWARDNAPENFDTVSVRHQNNGVFAHYRLWEEVESE